MAKKAKVENFTPEMSNRLAMAYKANPTAETVEAFANEFAKSERSIIAKLVNLGVYKKAEKAEGAKAETKEKIVADIANLAAIPAETLESLANATKAALVAVREAMREAAPDLYDSE